MIKNLLLFPLTLLSYFIGKFTWTAPPWWQSLANSLRRNRKATLGLFVITLAGVGAYLYYDSLPKPVRVTAQIDAIEITPNYSGAKPSDLNIEFLYDFSQLKDKQVRPDGEPSVARIDLVGKEIDQGITITPAKKGKWSWVSDRSIAFVPETDWPAGTEYSIRFDQAIFSAETLLANNTYQVTTAPLTASFSHTEFYQDPKDIAVRRVVATVAFSHPVDKKSFEQQLTMGMRLSDQTIDTIPTPYSFSITYDKNQREAYIQSEPVRLPERTNTMRLNLAKGIKSVLGGEASQAAQDTKVVIPDRYSFLKANAQSQIVRNQENEPQQVVMLEFTDDITIKELRSKLSMYLLPKNGQRNGRSYWSGPRQVNKNVIGRSLRVDYKLIANEFDFAKRYNFVVDVPENRYLYIKVDKGFKSVNNFVHSSFFDAVLTTPQYPKEVNIAGEGSVLSYSGNHQLSVLTRGVPGLKYSIGKLLEGQIYHLVSQTSGDLTSPSFDRWNFSEQNIADFETATVQLRQNHPRQANYSSLDLSRYLPKASGRFGLFFVDVKAYDPKRQREIYGANDKRLILVTDLGIVVKRNSDASHDLFVQSIADGNPVAGAAVELLGKNGLALFTGITDNNGHLSVPIIQSNGNARSPTVFVVKSKGDLSFIPFNRHSRQVNLSKFEIGGVQQHNYNPKGLNAFVFTDRGIYRPGEEVNIGMVVKRFNLSNVENIPLELIIRGPRNTQLKVKKFNLPTMGFADFQFPTEAVSDTGHYQASLHLVRDNQRRGREIGSVSFNVEEFQPDTMKIKSELAAVNNTGWNTHELINAKVELKNLFGTPAQDRKTRARLVITPHKFVFKDYQDYTFTDPYFDKDSKPLSLNTILEEKRTDADGIAEFELDLSKFKQGTYSLRFTAEGFDQAGGRSVKASSAALISPLETLVGFKANGTLNYINAQSKRAVEFIAIDKSLERKNADGLTLKLIEIQQISTLVKQRNGTYQYQTIQKEIEASTSPLTLTESGFQHSIDTRSPGDYALEVVDSQQRTMARVNYSVVGHANLAGKIDKNAELQLKLNKEDFFPGEEIKMSLRAPFAGAGLITIETDRVHQYKWFKTTTESTVQQIRLPEDLEGTGYVSVSFVRDMNSKEIFTSPLSYAVQPFSIDRSKRRIDVTLDTQDIVRPGKPMEIAFTTSKPARIAVFAIDEGILQVAKYNLPNPLSHFLKKRALGVNTLQILDLILPDFNIVKVLSASGGGEGRREQALAKNINPFTRKTDKPAVFWSGIYDASQEKNTVTFDVPNTFAGQLRIMAVAVGEASLGAGSSTATVRGPFVISPNVLTQAAPGDEFLVTVGVANIIDGAGPGAKVALSATASKHLEIIGPSSTSLTIDEGSEGKHTFKVKAKRELGSAMLTFTATHKDETASRSASLSVRPATTYYTSVTSDYDSDGDVELSVDRRLYADLAKQTVSASASPLVLVDGLSAYLENFPHGCTEQVVSKVFPLVGLMTHPAYGPHLPDVKNHFAHLIDKLRERQLNDGGFAFWPGHTDSAQYPTIYTMHFLLEAQEQGYPVPVDMMQRGKDYLKSYVPRSSSSLSSVRDRANAIYLLTRMGEVTTNFLVDLEEDLKKNYNKQWQQDLLSVYMAATYKMLQKDTEAERLIAGFELGAQHADLNDFRSPLAIDAQYIYLLAKHFENQAKQLDGRSIHTLTDKIFKGEYNTISSAYSILALGAYSKLVLADNNDEKIVFSGLNDKGQSSVLKAMASPFLKASYANDVTSVDIDGSGQLFYLNVQSGFDSSPSKSAIREGLEIFRSFVDEQGKEVTEFEQGKELTVKLKIRALGGKTLSNIAVVDLLPGGFEVIRSSVSRTAYNWRADYVDIREDRVVYYGDFDSSVRELSYKVKLTAAGQFVIPPSYAESMYDRSLRAISKSGRFIVTASQ
jgi:alpha-2-macroglobulin